MYSYCCNGFSVAGRSRSASVVLAWCMLRKSLTCVQFVLQQLLNNISFLLNPCKVSRGSWVGASSAAEYQPKSRFHEAAEDVGEDEVLAPWNHQGAIILSPVGCRLLTFTRLIIDGQYHVKFRQMLLRNKALALKLTWQGKKQLLGSQRLTLTFQRRLESRWRRCHTIRPITLQ